MQLFTISNIPQKILNFFTLEAERLGKETQFKRRRSKLTASAFIRALLATCLTGHFGLEVLGSVLKKQGIVIRKQSLHERFNERTVMFLKALSTSFLKQFQSEKMPHLQALGEFSALNIIDSSNVSLHSALSKLFKGSGGSASNAALKIQLMFDYLMGQIKELTLTSGCDNDQGFDYYFNSIQKGALYLMDLGYFKLDSFKKIIDGEAFFVSRLLTGTKLFTPEKQSFDLLTTLSNAAPVFSQQLLMGAYHHIQIRLVAQRLPEELANRRRQKLLEAHRRRRTSPSKESLALQSWSIYITNTTQAQIDNQHIHQTYALRWQVELVFKLSKSLMQVDSIKSMKSSRVIVETYGKFICMMLLFLLCEPARYQNGKELSWYKACKLFIIESAELARAFTSIRLLKVFITSFFQTLTLFARKDIKKNAFVKALSSRDSF
jgi:hypothetical protein